MGAFLSARGNNWNSKVVICSKTTCLLRRGCFNRDLELLLLFSIISPCCNLVFSCYHLQNFLKYFPNIMDMYLKSQSTFWSKIKIVKSMKVLLYTYFYNISLNVLKPTFFNIYNLPFAVFSNIAWNELFSYFMRSWNNTIAVFNIFSLVCS